MLANKTKIVNRLEGTRLNEDLSANKSPWWYGKQISRRIRESETQTPVPSGDNPSATRGEKHPSEAKARELRCDKLLSRLTLSMNLLRSVVILPIRLAIEAEN